MNTFVLALPRVVAVPSPTRSTARLPGVNGAAETLAPAAIRKHNVANRAGKQQKKLRFIKGFIILNFQELNLTPAHGSPVTVR